jgi:hypothetical protein
MVIGEKLDPDLMNTAGANVKIVICQTKIVSRPGDNVCVDCHDASYKTMQTDWKMI